MPHPVILSHEHFPCSGRGWYCGLVLLICFGKWARLPHLSCIRICADWDGSRSYLDYISDEVTFMFHPTHSCHLRIVVLFDHGVELMHGIGEQALLPEDGISSAVFLCIYIYIYGDNSHFEDAKILYFVHSSTTARRICHYSLMILVEDLSDYNCIEDLFLLGQDDI